MYIPDATTADDDTTTASHNNNNSNAMMIEAVPTSTTPSHHLHHTHMAHLSAGPKKRAETWVQDETRSLISLRRDMDALFNTSKSNKHLWEQISLKMRERGFERSATMCTDKWRNLLKEFKKVKHSNSSISNNSSGNGSNSCSNNGGGVVLGKMPYYKEIEEILKERNRCSSSRQGQLDDGSGGSASGGGVSGNGNGGGNHSSRVDPFSHFSDKGIDDASIPFGPVEANGRPTFNLERRLDHEGHPLAVPAADAVTSGDVPPFWRETPGNGDDSHSYGGRVITVKWGDYTRRIGVDGTADAIKDVIRSAFGLRSKRAFWLEDDDQVVRSLDRDMPLRTYTLHLDEGMTIKLCHYEESDHIPYPGPISHTEEKTFYTEMDFRDFLNRRGWSSLRELSGYRNIDNLDDLRPDALYRGIT